MLAGQGTRGHCCVAPAHCPCPSSPTAPPEWRRDSRESSSGAVRDAGAESSSNWVSGPQSPIHKVRVQSEDSEAPPPPALTVHSSQARSLPRAPGPGLPSSLPSVLRGLPGRGARGSSEARCTGLALSPARTSAEDPPLHYPLPLPTRKQAEAGTRVTVRIQIRRKTCKGGPFPGAPFPRG